MSFPLTLRFAFGGTVSDESIVCCPFCGCDRVAVTGFVAEGATRNPLLRLSMKCENCPDLKNRELSLRTEHGRTYLCWVVV